MPKSPIPAKDDDLSTRALLVKLNTRLATVAVACGAAVVASAASIVMMMPLKETKPYIVEVYRDGSAIVPPQKEAVAYNPTEDSLQFFLRRWIGDVFTINPYNTTSKLDPRARLFLRGQNALGEYNDFLASDGKFVLMAEKPQLTRDVEILGVTQIAGTKNAYMFDVKLSTRFQGELTEQRRLVTVYYEIFHPKDRKDVENNPLGIYVTSFKVGFSNEGIKK